MEIIYDLQKCGLRGRLMLADGSDLLKAPGTLHITGGVLETRDDRAFGAIHLLEAHDGSDDWVVNASPQSFSIECTISPDQVIALIETERSGSGFRGASIGIPDGLTYGSLPDGSDKRWDDSNKKWLAVNELIFSFYEKNENHLDELNLSESTKNSEIFDEISNLNQNFSNYFKFGLVILIFMSIVIIFK